MSAPAGSCDISLHAVKPTTKSTEGTNPRVLAFAARLTPAENLDLQGEGLGLELVDAEVGRGPELLLQALG